MPTIPITVAYGDGIGPEIMNATLHILKDAGAKLDIERIEIGAKVYLSGNTSGIDPSAWDSLRNTKVFLKAPITTPQGGGYKSRSEEHTSELQSHLNLVCRLLLEKKKKDTDVNKLIDQRQCVEIRDYN